MRAGREREGWAERGKRGRGRQREGGVAEYIGHERKEIGLQWNL